MAPGADWVAGAAAEASTNIIEVVSRWGSSGLSGSDKLSEILISLSELINNFPYQLSLIRWGGREPPR